ncbi:unnamed protein product [Polarella glacialis]|uniref:methylated-DNA--[protein]-cysteine S-methyltransferase n=1 Tax=Polarella glacialis TaxID=89957 RepID=A0A813L9Q2_POLGL|nr:unnamed protein product [Polarella glacialis]
MKRFLRLAPTTNDNQPVIELSDTDPEAECQEPLVAKDERPRKAARRSTTATRATRATTTTATTSSLRSSGPSSLHEEIYALVRSVPKGRVTTYGAVAQALGRGCARNIGTAMRKNPYGCEAMP